MAKRKQQSKRVRAQSANMGRRRRRRRGKRAVFYGFLLFCLLLIGAVYLFTQHMKIERVEVIGVEKYAPDEIIAASGIEPEQNLLRVDKHAVQQALLNTFPYLRAVEVRSKLWPPRIEIAVEQAQPVGAIVQDGEVVLIDEDGKVLERGVLLIPEKLLLVKGIDASGVGPGAYLGEYTPPSAKELERLADELAAGLELTENEREERQKNELYRLQEIEEEKQAHARGIHERLVMLRYLLEAMERSGFTQLTNVDLTDRLNMRINYENRITLELGSESQLLDKLQTAQFVLDNHIGPEESGTLDVTEVYRDQVRFDPVPSRRYHYSLEEDKPANLPGAAAESPLQSEGTAQDNGTTSTTAA